jgi:hypothetical protein
MEKNIRIVLNDNQTNERIQLNLEDDFDNLEILSLKISSTDAYRKSSSNFGVIVGRVQTTNGYGLQNARVSIFVPITGDDKLRPEITEIYPFETVNDQFPNGVRYNLLPRNRNQNPSHRAVGNLPNTNDFVHYPQYVEIMEKYYKYTTVTNDSGDYMIFGVPVGSHSIMMDFDLFDTKSFELSANDLVETTTQYTSIQAIAASTGTANSSDVNQIPNYIYQSDGTFNVEVKTNINEMPNIFNEVKQINVSPFWGDDVEHDIGITRCDFKINYSYTPTAIFFGWVASPSAGYHIKSDYRFSLFDEKPLEVFGFDKSLNRDTCEVWPLDNMVVVVYRLDDKLTPGSRVRVGAFKAEPHTGIFRISLPMYMDYYKLTQFGDMVPTDDTKNSIPTKGYYAFELYENGEAFQTRIPWGGYALTPTPGIRIPASVNGEPLTGGWEGTTNGLFEYDLINKKRKFYTLKTKYTKHRIDNVALPGSELTYFPSINPNKDIEWNFPVSREDAIYIENVEIIGSALIPRYSIDVNPGFFDYNKIDYTNENYDKDYDPFLLYPINILNIQWIPPENSYGEKVKFYEYHTGIGSGLFGLNQGKVFSQIFRGNDFLDYNTGENFYGDSRTYNFGDNSDGPLNLSLFAVELAKSNEATTNDSGVHRRFTQAYSPTMTLGPFISSTNYIDNSNFSIFSFNRNKYSVLETSIYDITDELKELIDDKVYTSYGFYTGNAAPTSFDPDISNRYKGNYYYFGYWDGSNVLKSIEKNYFTNNG